MDSDHTLELRALGFFLGFIFLHHAMLALQRCKSHQALCTETQSRRGDPGVAADVGREPAALRDGVDAGSGAAGRAPRRHDGRLSLVARIWRAACQQRLPGLSGQYQEDRLSLAYFSADVYWYAVPKRDGLILFHHLTMLLCHYPVGSVAGLLAFILV